METQELELLMLIDSWLEDDFEYMRLKIERLVGFVAIVHFVGKELFLVLFDVCIFHLLLGGNIRTKWKMKILWNEKARRDISNIISIYSSLIFKDFLPWFLHFQIMRSPFSWQNYKDSFAQIWTYREIWNWLLELCYRN